MASYKLTITDEQIIKAAESWSPKHADAPTDRELCDLVDIIAQADSMGSYDMLNVGWLRNKFVQLRKKHGLKTSKAA